MVYLTALKDTYSDLLMTQDDIERFLFEGIEYNIPEEVDFDSFDFGDDITKFLKEYLITADLHDSSIDLLSNNPCAIQWLLSHPEYISWKEFSSNIHTRAVRHLINNPDKIDWTWFSTNSNPLAVSYLLAHVDKIDVKWFCSNVSPRAVHRLEQFIRDDHPDIDWKIMSKNVSAIHILKKHLDKVNWEMLSKNPKAIELIKHELTKRDSKVSFEYLSSNNHPEAIDILMAYPRKIVWRRLAGNRNAMQLILDNVIDMKWTWLSSNPMVLNILKHRQNKIWDKSFYFYCFWRPYEDDFGDRNNYSFDKDFDQTSQLTISESLSQQQLSQHHYLYMCAVMSHERLESRLLRERSCVTGDELNQCMLKDIEMGDVATSKMYNQYQNLKSQRMIITHASSMMILETSRTLDVVRNGSSVDDSRILKVATSAIEILIRYQRVLEEWVNRFPDLKKVKNLSLRHVIHRADKLNIDTSSLVILYECRKHVAHARDWFELEAFYS